MYRQDPHNYHDPCPMKMHYDMFCCCCCCFFWCYLSSQLTELIDILHSEETKISRARTLPGMTLGSVWPSGVPALIARWASETGKPKVHASEKRCAWREVLEKTLDIPNPVLGGLPYRRNTHFDGNPECVWDDTRVRVGSGGVYS